MKKKKIKILIVDDHPMIVEAYKAILASSELEELYQFTIDTANNCDSAIHSIDTASAHKAYEVLFFDVQLPPSADGKIISGQGLASYAKKKLPKAKIIILTSFNENDRIRNILTTVNPDGLLIKNDVTPKEFIIAFNAVINNPPYYSTTVANYFRKKVTDIDNSLLDDINRKIIYHLSKGVKTKNLVNYVNLSLSAINKRKNHIRELFDLDNANDEQLVKEAKKRGFI